MAQKTKGLGANPLVKKTGTGGRDRGLSIVGALHEASAAAGGVRAVKVSEIARNPENPENRWADEGLVVSVGEVGVLVPLTVMSAQVFLEVFPEHVEAIGDRPWVALAGHRRHNAAEKASVLEVPVLVRDDLGERAGEVMLGENLHRAALSPLQEARAYQRNLDRTGLSQRKLAAHLGVPQSQISKRLSLLALPEILHAYIDAGEVDLETAQSMIEPLSDERVREVFVEKMRAGTPHTQSLHQAKSHVRELVRREIGAAAAETEGVEFIESPSQKFGSSYYRHHLHSAKDISRARKAGTLVIGPASAYEDKPTYWTTAKPSSTSARSEEERAEAKARTAARKARRAHLETAAMGALTADADRWQRLVILHGLSMSANATTNARKLCQAQGIGPKDAEDWPWRGAVARDRRQPRPLAALIAVSLLEEQLSLTHVSIWSPLACDFFDWLIGTGYVPTEWELKRREESGRRAAETGDSVESLASEQTEDAGAGDVADELGEEA